MQNINDLLGISFPQKEMPNFGKNNIELLGNEPNIWNADFNQLAPLNTNFGQEHPVITQLMNTFGVQPTNYTPDMQGGNHPVLNNIQKLLGSDQFNVISNAINKNNSFDALNKFQTLPNGQIVNVGDIANPHPFLTGLTQGFQDLRQANQNGQMMDSLGLKHPNTLMTPDNLTMYANLSKLKNDQDNADLNQVYKLGMLKNAQDLLPFKQEEMKTKTEKLKKDIELAGTTGNSKAEFISIMRYMDTPEFEALPDEQKARYEARADQLAKAPDTLFSQNYSSKKGKNKADIEDSGTIAFNKSQGEESGKLGIVGQVEAEKAGAKAETEQYYKDLNEYKDTMSNMSSLVETVNKMKDLSNKMTYTGAGRAYNEIRKQMGLPATEGAVSRAEYIATAKNVLFPILKQTFGAQFTQKEGESLLSTLGDPNSTPQEMQAVLDSFINQKLKTIEAKSRKIQSYSNSGSPQKNTSKPKSSKKSGWSF